MDTNAVQVIETFGNKLDHYINALASKAGVAADHFYPIFVHQQTIEGVFAIVSLIGAGIGAALCFRMAIKNLGAKYSEEDKSAKSVLGFILGAVLTLGFVIGFTSVGQQSVSQLINPEYYAVQNLVHMVK